MKPEIPYRGPVKWVMGDVIYVDARPTAEIIVQKCLAKDVTRNDAYKVRVERPGGILIIGASVDHRDFTDDLITTMVENGIGAIIARPGIDGVAFHPEFVRAATKAGIACCELGIESHARLVEMIGKYGCEVSVDMASLQGGLSNFFDFIFVMDEGHRQALLYGTWFPVEV